MLRPGGILTLDEFWTSLDKETERTLIEQLMRTAIDKTMIFITHRDMIKLLRRCGKAVELPERT